MSVLTGIVVSGVLAICGGVGDIVGYIALGSMFVVWMIGYLYIVNKIMRPEIKTMLLKKEYKAETKLNRIKK